MRSWPMRKLPPQMAVYKMAVAEIGWARYDLVARLKSVNAAGMESAAGRYLRRARDVGLEQDMLLFNRRVGNRDVCEQGFGVGMRGVLVDIFCRRYFDDDPEVHHRHAV